IDGVRIIALKKEALSGNRNKAVEDEARKLSGLDPRNIKQNAITDYEEALQAKLKEIDPSLTKRQARIIASQMSHKDFKDLKDEFAKAKYGKEHSELNATEKAKIDDIVGGKYISKKALAENAKNKGKNL